MAVAEFPAAEGRTHRHHGRTDRNGLEVLDKEMCLALLSGSTVGRVAYIGGGAARIVPVNISVFDGAVLFHVGTGGLLAAIIDGQQLSLETDLIEDGRGWSIVVTGQAHEMAYRPDRSRPVVPSSLRPDAARLACLTPLEISGRRLLNPVGYLGSRPQPKSALQPDVSALSLSYRETQAGTIPGTG